MPNTILEYRYRDAGNFKADGAVLLDGQADPSLVNAAMATLQDGDFFIAEQVGIPPLYDQLYRWSGGPTAQDHCWHEFVGVHPAENEQTYGDLPCLGCANTFFERWSKMGQWRGELSPHWAIA